jgi:prepilin-type N-terminal cleavage/methylation domain-containing protein
MKTSMVLRNRSQGKIRVSSAFTLVELLTVIAIIVILLGLLFPTIRVAKEGGRKARASAEVRRIAVAVQSFHTEYGRYPILPPSGRPGIDVAVGDECIGLKIRNRELFYSLRSMNAGMNTEFAVNPRKVVYFEGPNASDSEHPHDGFLTNAKDGDQRDCYFDPWGREYCVAIDYSYDGILKLAYMDYSGDHAPRIGVGAFSLGADQSLGASGNMTTVDGKKTADDVISWN